MCVNFKSRHFSNYTIFRLENLCVFYNSDELLTGKLKFEHIRTSNASTQDFVYTFECKQILFLSVLPWNNTLQVQTMSTLLEDKRLKVRTASNGGCYIYAILLV